MKQHITVSQLRELTEEQINKVLIKEWGTVTAVKHAKEHICKEYFNIGRMIEFLYKEDFNIDITILLKKKVTISRCGMDEPLTFKSLNLVDALWEAIKTIL